ncbi:LysR family transcriptional regulator [Achromobacter sp. NFACC18-2]|uniref:LysR family transcriptional regulator n=1 Tax=Achromobacter sp. NFACC18-2 TaxID=1564112 RepID=UPI0008D28BE0|nr:LysR family transcriptional regulator [Achromobacter sp. NFACC18-2]SEJ90926.1 transcriptional regulator, LysR family [Achromobacter sp. NFACC18-2]
MNRNDISMQDLHYFVEVAKRGKLSATAAGLGIPVATLSRRLTQLEQTLGYKLLNRTTRSVSLTAIGQRYFDECAAHVQGALSAHEVINASLNHLAGTLRVSVMPGLTTILPAVLKELRATYPQISFEVELGTSDIARNGQQFDLMLRTGDLEDSALIQKHVAQVHWVLVAASSYLDRFGRPTCPEDLGLHERIITGDLPDWTLGEGEGLLNVRGPAHIGTNSSALGVQLATAGLGIAWMPSHLALSQTLRELALEQILPDWKLPPATIYALSDNRFTPARAKVFIDTLQRHLQVN